MKAIEPYKKSIKKLCRNFHVDELYVFDAALLGATKPCKFGFVVRFDISDLSNYGNNYYALKNELNKLMGCDMELIEEQALKNPFMKKLINTSKITLYGRQDKGMAV